MRDRFDGKLRRAGREVSGAAGRPRDLEVIAELEALREERERRKG